MDKKKLETFKKKLETRQQELRHMVTRNQQDGRTADESMTIEKTPYAIVHLVLIYQTLYT